MGLVHDLQLRLHPYNSSRSHRPIAPLDVFPTESVPVIKPADVEPGISIEDQSSGRCPFHPPRRRAAIWPLRDDARVAIPIEAPARVDDLAGVHREDQR